MAPGVATNATVKDDLNVVWAAEIEVVSHQRFEKPRACGAPQVLIGWVTADEVYGGHRGFRDCLATHQVPFVLTTRSDDTLPLPGRRRRLAHSQATEISTAAWERHSAGAGAHGLRVYDWARVAFDPAGLRNGWVHWLLIPPPDQRQW